MGIYGLTYSLYHPEVYECTLISIVLTAASNDVGVISNHRQKWDQEGWLLTSLWEH